MVAGPARSRISMPCERFSRFFRLVARVTETGVQPFQFDAGVLGRELPVGFGVMVVSMALPGRGFFLEGLFVGDAAAQALGGENGEFGLGHVEPASVLWRVMPFAPVDEAARFGGGG